MENTPLKELKNILRKISEKILVDHSNGYYDSSTTFQILVKQLLKVQYETDVIDLNEIHFNFPSVDLKCENKYIQVTTQRDLKTKITDAYSSLPNVLNDPKYKEFHDIKEIYFYTIDDISSPDSFKIGNHKYIKSRHHLTPGSFIKSIKNEPKKIDEALQICRRFYGNSNSFFEQLDDSKARLKQYVSYYLGKKEFHLNREGYLKQLNNFTGKVCILSGNKGVGKSAIIKEFIEDKHFFYLHGSDILRYNSLKEMLGFEITEFVFKYSSPLYIVVDSLEKIANSKNSISIIQRILDVATNVSNIKIIFSCCSGFESFFTFLGDYIDLSIEVKPLETNEIKELENFSKFLNNVLSFQKISCLSNLAIINTLLMRNKSVGSINTDYDLYLLIYKTFIATTKAEEKLVENLLIGTTNFFQEKSSRIENTLLSLIERGVILKTKDEKYTFYYDIYEDIIFFGNLKRELEKSIGNDFNNLFLYIKRFGPTVLPLFNKWFSFYIDTGSDYEQILVYLIEHKEKNMLFFEASLKTLFSKNRFTNFFNNFSSVLDLKNLTTCLDIINRDCFAEDKFLKSLFKDQFRFRPIGLARFEILKYIQTENLINQIPLEKILDAIESLFNFKDVKLIQTCDVSSLIINIIEKELKESPISPTIIKKCLTGLIVYQNQAKDWILSYLKYLTESEDTYEISTLRNYFFFENGVHYSEFFTNELCIMASAHWLKNEKEQYSNYLLESFVNSSINYDYESKRAVILNFIFNGLLYDWKTSIDFLISFTNSFIELCVNSGRYKKDFLVVDGKKMYKYYDFNLWSAGLLDNNLPYLIKGSILCLRHYILNLFYEKDFKTADSIKRKILKESNSYLLLGSLFAAICKYGDANAMDLSDLVTSVSVLEDDTFFIFGLRNRFSFIDEYRVDNSLKIKNFANYMLLLQLNYMEHPFTLDGKLKTARKAIEKSNFSKKRKIELLFQVDKCDLKKSNIEIVGDEAIRITTKSNDEIEKLHKQDEFEMFKHLKDYNYFLNANNNSIKKNVQKMKEFFLKEKTEPFDIIVEKSIFTLLKEYFSKNYLSKASHNWFLSFIVDSETNYKLKGYGLMKRNESLLELVLSEFDNPKTNNQTRFKITLYLIRLLFYYPLEFKENKKNIDKFLREHSSVAKTLISVIFNLSIKKVEEEKYYYSEYNKIHKQKETYSPNISWHIDYNDFRNESIKQFEISDEDVIIRVLSDKRNTSLPNVDVSIYDVLILSLLIEGIDQVLPKENLSKLINALLCKRQNAYSSRSLSILNSNSTLILTSYIEERTSRCNCDFVKYVLSFIKPDTNYRLAANLINESFGKIIASYRWDSRNRLFIKKIINEINKNITDDIAFWVADTMLFSSENRANHALTPLTPLERRFVIQEIKMYSSYNRVVIFKAIKDFELFSDASLVFDLEEIINRKSKFSTSLNTYDTEWLSLLGSILLEIVSLHKKKILNNQKLLKTFEKLVSYIKERGVLLSIEILERLYSR